MRINTEAMCAYARKDIQKRRVEINFMKPDAVGKDLIFAKPIEWHAIESGDEGPSALSLPYETATQLMDELWSAGVRPSDNISNAGEKKALENHIKALEAHNAFLQGVVNHQLGRVL